MDPQGGALLGNAHGYIDIDASGVSRGLNQAKGEFNNFITSTGAMFTRMGDSLTAFGSQMTMFTAPLLVAGGFGLKVASDFDSVLTEIQARTGLTTEAMEQVRQAALQAGADTSFSSQQAAEAFLNLLTAGLSTEDALAALTPVLNAAAAGNMDLGRAADYTTSIMASFQLKATDTTRIVDAMAKASGATPATMDEMGAALLRSSASAAQFGFTVEETSAILAIFAQRGLRGEQAGTQLNSMLRNMNSQAVPTKEVWKELGISMYDATGQARDLDAVFADLRVALDGMTDENRNRVMMQLAGSEGMLGFQALLAGESIASMTAQMDAQASTADIATQIMNSFAGQVDSLKGSVETLWITVLTPFMNNVLRPLIGMMIGGVNAVTAWAAANEPLVQTIVTMTTAFLSLGPLLWGVGRGCQFIGFILTAIGSPIGLLISAVGVLAYLFRDQLAGVLSRVKLGFEIFFGALNDGASPLQAFGLALSSIFGPDAANTVIGFFDTIGTLLGRFQRWLAGLGAAFKGGGLGGVASYIYDSFMSVDWLGLWGDVLNAAKTALSTIDWGQLGRDISDFIFAPQAGSDTSLFSTFMDALVMGFDFLVWVTENVVLPFLEGFLAGIPSVDWGLVGTAILDALGVVLNALWTAGTWIWDNFLSPMLSALGTALASVDWMQLGTDILDALGRGLRTLGRWLDWAWDNLIAPLIDSVGDALGQVDWAAVGTTLLDLLGSALNVLWAGATWVWDNLISPMINAVGGALAQVDWMQLGLDLLNALGEGLLMLWSAGTWAYDNLIVPMLDNAKLAIEQIDWSQVGADIVNAIGAALKATFDFMAWIIDSLFNPMTENADAATGQINWSGVGASIMGAISGAIIGVYNFIKWLKDTIFGPLLDGAGEAINNLNWTSIGHNLFSAIANALPDIAKWVQDNIIKPISDALAGFDPIGMIMGSSGAHVGNAGAFAAAMANSPNVSSSGSLGSGGTGNMNFGTPFASGINFIPETMLGLLHPGEAVIPANMNPFNPNAERGLGGGDIHIEQIIVPGVRNYGEGLEAGRGIGDGIRETLRQKGGGRG